MKLTFTIFTNPRAIPSQPIHQKINANYLSGRNLHEIF